jgi:NAD(P)-binding Rossmann-like domain
MLNRGLNSISPRGLSLFPVWLKTSFPATATAPATAVSSVTASMRSLLMSAKTFTSSSYTPNKQNESTLSQTPKTPPVILPHVAVIGGGIAGLSAASKLAKLKIPTTVFDMGTRVPGGRACSRILTEESKELAFDHGAQFIAPRAGGNFEKEVQSWVAAGVAAPWNPARFGSLDSTTGKFTPEAQQSSNDGFCGMFHTNVSTNTNTNSTTVYVGVPNQGAIAKYLATTIKNASTSSIPSSTSTSTPTATTPTPAVVADVHPNDSKVKIGHKVTGLFYNKTEKLWTVEGVPRSASATTPAVFGKFNAVVVADALVVLPDSAGYARGLVEEKDKEKEEGDGDEEGEERFYDKEVQSIVEKIQSVKHQPVFSLLVAFEDTTNSKNEHDNGESKKFNFEEMVPFDGATVISSTSSGGSTGSFQWIARNSSKPGRVSVKKGSGLNADAGDEEEKASGNSQSTWVAITTPERAYKLLETWPLHTTKGVYNPQTHEYRDAVAKELLGEFIETVEKAVAVAAEDGAADTNDDKSKIDLRSRVVYFHAQRWGRGFVETPLKVDYLGSESVLFAACGDFCGGKKVDGEAAGVMSPVEAAWQSGQKAADAVASWLGNSK